MNVRELRKALERAERAGYGDQEVYLSSEPDGISPSPMDPYEDNLYLTALHENDELADMDIWLVY